MALTSWEKFWQYFLDLVAPPSEETRYVRRLSPKDLSLLPPEKTTKKDFITAVCNYRKAAVRAVVHAAKYDGSRQACRLMAEVVASEILAICAEERIFGEKIVITHIPMTHRKEHQRGYNQSKCIAQHVAKIETSGSCRHECLLEKIHPTKAQTHLSHRARRKNLHNAFRYKEADGIAGNTVFVIDDVTTTGATLSEARRALQAGNPEKIFGLAFAH